MAERKETWEMTDREIAEETLTILRAGQDAVMGMMSNPMFAAMLPTDDPVTAAMESRKR